MLKTNQPLKRYDCWYNGVGEVMIGSIEAKSHREARRLFINRLVMKIRKKEKGTMKQLLIVIEGKDCEECERHERECSHECCEYECKFCNNKAKFPTKLIFDAEGFEYEMYKGELLEISELRKIDIVKSEDLPIETQKKFNVYSGFAEVRIEGTKKFRLSSDAVLKSVGDKIREGCHCAGGDCEVCQLVTMINNHNLSESSKIVIATGYYE